MVIFHIYYIYDFVYQRVHPIQHLSLLGWLRHRLFLLDLPDFDARRLGAR